MTRITARHTVVATDHDDCLFDFEGAFNPWLVARGHLDPARLDALTGEARFSTRLLLGCDETTAHDLEVAFLADAMDHVIPGAVPAITALARRGEVHLVTARVHQLHDDVTRAWLDRHFAGLFTTITLAVPTVTDPGPGKGHVCQQIGATLLIDDHPRHLDDAARYGIATLQFGEKHWSAQGRHPRARDWADVLTQLDAA